MDRSRNLIILCLVITGLVVYSFNLAGPLFWDDLDLVINNPVIQSPGVHLKALLLGDMLAGNGQVSNYYRPLLMVSFALNWSISGASPWSYHLLSNSLHIASAIMLFILFAPLLSGLSAENGNKRTVNRTGLILAGLASIYWLVHPVQAEAVAYIAGRGDPLAAFFMFTALYLWMRAEGVIAAVESESARPARFRGFALVAAVLALASRETSVLLPAYLVLLSMVFQYRETFWLSLWKSVLQAWPIILISLIYILLRLTVLNFDNTLNFYTYENEYTRHVSVRLWTFLSALPEYLRLTFIPTGLHFEHSVPIQLSPSNTQVVTGALLLSGSVAWVILAWRKGNRVPFLGVGLFFIPFALSSGVLVPINSVFSEHWLYLCLAGAGLLLAFYGMRLMDYVLRVAGKGLLFSALAVVFIAYGLFLAGSAVGRNVLVTSPENLYLEVLDYEPGNVRILNNLANVYASEGKLDAAEVYWLKAADADPSQAWPHHNLANLELQRGNVDQAEALYLKAISLRPAQEVSYRNLAGLLMGQERHENALEVMQALLQLAPGDTVIYYNIAKTYHALGRDSEARATLDEGQQFVRSAEGMEGFNQLRAQLQ